MTKALALLAAALMLAGSPAAADEDLRAEISELRTRLEQLEQKVAGSTGEGAQGEDAEALAADVRSMKEALEEAEGPVQTAIADVAKLKKIKVSGYLQGRYESYSTPAGVASKGDNKAPDNRFYLRRGRFKIAGKPTDKTLGVVQLDLAGYDRSKVETKDVYIEVHPWGIGVPAPFYVRLGQQNWPFGYVIERSSSAREVPERPKVFAGTTVGLSESPSFAGLFGGERDRGIALFSTEASKLEWALGVFNGTGVKAGDAGSAFLQSGGRFEDNNGSKAIVGRIRYPVSESLSVGTSIYRGSQAVRPVSSAPAAVSVDQTRWGLDFQYYAQGASLKGEYVTGREPYYSNTSATPNGTSGTNRRVSGWYLVATKNIGRNHQFVAQYDVLEDRAMASTFGKLTTWNLGIIRFLDNATKLKLFYEINKEQFKSSSNNGLRVELLTVF